MLPSARVVFTFGSLALASLAGLTGIATSITGCGDDETPGTSGSEDASAGDATSENKPKPPSPMDDSGSVRTRATCIAGCTEKYPNGRTKDDAVEACWTLNCAGPCISGDAGDVNPGELTCPTNPITTGSGACDQCTQTSCCTEWDTCFNDNDCVEFNQCRNGCPEE